MDGCERLSVKRSRSGRSIRAPSSNELFQVLYAHLIDVRQRFQVIHVAWVALTSSSMDFVLVALEE